MALTTIQGTGAFDASVASLINGNFAAVDLSPDYWVRPQASGPVQDGSYAKPFGSMSLAQSVMAPGVVIGLEGVLREYFTAPLGVNNVTIVGVAVVPRQSTTSGVPNGGGATWLSPTTVVNASDLCVVRGQGWTFQNIYFNNAGTSSADVLLSRSGTGDPPLDPDGSHAAFINCRFTGTALGLEDEGGSGFVHVDQCEFFNFSGAGDCAIKNTSTAIALPLRWVITNSAFWGNANHIIAAASGWTIKGCTFKAATTTNIDFTGGAAPNFVQQNAFGIAAADFDPAGGVTGVSGDAWSNYLTDAVETGLPAN